MRKSDFNIGIVCMLLIILCPFTLTAGSDWNNIQKAIGFVANQPFAVKYRINDNNIIADQIRDAYLKNKTDPSLSGNTGHSHLFGECLYVSDGSGNERFQYSENIMPLDMELYPDLATTDTCSLTRFDDKTVIYHQDVNGLWESFKEIMPENYLTNKSHSNLRYPLFGLALFMRQNPSGFQCVTDALQTNCMSEIQSGKILDNINFILNSQNILISFSEKGIPSKILYESFASNWQLLVEVSEIGITEQGYAYPKKAKMERSYDCSLLQETFIEVTDILIGSSALEKYPLEPILNTENIDVIDSR